MRSVVASYIASLVRFISESASSTPNPVVEESAFNRLALALFAFQFEHVEAYRRLCQFRGLSPAQVNCWSEIPAVPVAAFKELDLTSLPPDQRNFVFHSSGTTQQAPSRHFHDGESLALYEKSLWPWFQRHLLNGAPTTTSLLTLAPAPVDAPHSSLSHMLETVRRALAGRTTVCGGVVARGGLWQLDSDACLGALDVSVTTNRPLLIPGTAFNFVHLIDLVKSRRHGLKLPPGSRVMETGGYKGRSRSLPREELHELIGAHLGIPASQIVCEYGMSELSSQAYDHIAGIGERPGDRIFQFPRWARARIVSPETGNEVAVGQMGLIQIFDLANVRSVMAIQTDDLGVRRVGGFDLAGRADRTEPRGCSLQTG